MALKTKSFKNPYVGVDTEKYSMLYTTNGDYSVSMRVANPVLTFCGDPKKYYGFHSLLGSVIKTLGVGHTIQKQDVFTKKTYRAVKHTDFLSSKNQEHFDGREYTEITTYLTITKNSRRGMFYQYDSKEFVQFQRKVQKVVTQLESKGMKPELMKEKALRQFARRMMTVNFTDHHFSLTNIKSSSEALLMGDFQIKCVSLVDIDEVEIPEVIEPCHDEPKLDSPFPVDLMGFLHKVPDYESMVFNQVVTIPDQNHQVAKLKAKRRNHSNIPDPANEVSMDDIDKLLKHIVGNSQLIVQAHFNVMLKTSVGGSDKAIDYIESQLFDIGIVPSKNAYNQLELFRASLPGNTGELKDYDRFLTVTDSALCFFFKEQSPVDEESNFKVYFTDREGRPIVIDTCDLPVLTQRTNNRNFFTLGPSGSGKSFKMNHLVRQYFRNGMDIVMVDTGHSYWGLCQYYGGRYITYTEEKPITMNPFRIELEEYNEEKREFLVSLLGIIWKGADGSLNGVEHTVLSSVVKSYYSDFFGRQEKDKQQLSFNTFYEYSVEQIRSIMETEGIPFNIQEYQYILKKFYQGGQYERILNDETDRALFDEKLIIFEIDAIKDHKILSPITTIIIMDVFIQKMRNKPGRKALVIEEAWKAIASPLMAQYIVYLYKTVRKFWGLVGIITQDLEDIISSDIVQKCIIKNSGTTFLLDQENLEGDFGEVAKLLGLNEIEQSKIFTINQLDNREGRGKFKEVYIRRGAVGEVYGIEGSFYEYLLYTTERVEKDAVQIYVQRSGQLEAGLEQFITDFQDSGRSLEVFCQQITGTSQEPEPELLSA